MKNNIATNLFILNSEGGDPLEEIVRGFTFKPATLDGKVISTVDTREFDYTALSKH